MRITINPILPFLRILIFAVAHSPFLSCSLYYKPPNAIQVGNCQQTIVLNPFENFCLVYNKAAPSTVNPSNNAVNEFLFFHIVFQPTIILFFHCNTFSCWKRTFHVFFLSCTLDILQQSSGSIVSQINEIFENKKKAKYKRGKGRKMWKELLLRPQFKLIHFFNNNNNKKKKR